MLAANKIMIFEKDSVTVNAISRLLDTVNLEPKVMYNWNSRRDRINLKEIMAVFIDIEMPMLAVDEIVSTLLEK